MVKILIIIAVIIFFTAFSLYILLARALAACGAHMKMQENTYISSMGEQKINK